MSPSCRDYDQNLLDTTATRIKTYAYQEKDLTDEVIKDFFDALSIPRSVGLGWAYTQNGVLTVLAVSSKESTLFIHLAKKGSQNESVLAARLALQTHILCNPEVTLYAFDMGRLALSLYRDCDIRVANAVHVQNACKTKDAHKVENAVAFAVNGTDIEAYRGNIEAAFRDMTWDAEKPVSMRGVVFRAWLAAYMPNIGDMEERFREVKRVNSQSVSEVVSLPC